MFLCQYLAIFLTGTSFFDRQVIVRPIILVDWIGPLQQVQPVRKISSNQHHPGCSIINLWYVCLKTYGFSGALSFYSIPLYIPYPIHTHKLPYYPGSGIPPFPRVLCWVHRGHHSHLQQGFIFCCHIIFGHCISWFFAQTLQHFA